jgi:hypothetical protein
LKADISALALSVAKFNVPLTTFRLGSTELNVRAIEPVDELVDHTFPVNPAPQVKPGLSQAGDVVRPTLIG